jgi:hypothetical protein
MKVVEAMLLYLNTPPVILLLHVLLVLFLSWLYFRRYQVTRPPIGVFSLGDVAFMLGGIVLIPYLYLSLPRWIIGGLLLLGASSILYFVLEPILRARWAIWLVTLCLVLADLGTAWGLGTQSKLFILVNNLIQLLSVVGVTVLWVQSGMKARDLTVLAVALAGYDFLSTTQLPLMGDLFSRLSGLPFAPLVVWPVASAGQWLGIGLGDLLLAAAFPLVMRKAFRRIAGLAALLIGLGALAILLVLPMGGVFAKIFPVMVVLGPLMGLQYLYWRYQCGAERTMWQYLLAEPTHRDNATSG